MSPETGCGMVGGVRRTSPDEVALFCAWARMLSCKILGAISVAASCALKFEPRDRKCSEASRFAALSLDPGRLQLMLSQIREGNTVAGCALHLEPRDRKCRKASRFAALSLDPGRLQLMLSQIR